VSLYTGWQQIIFQLYAGRLAVCREMAAEHSGWTPETAVFMLGAPEFQPEVIAQ